MTNSVKKGLHKHSILIKVWWYSILFWLSPNLMCLAKPTLNVSTNNICAGYSWYIEFLCATGFHCYSNTIKNTSVSHIVAVFLNYHEHTLVFFDSIPTYTILLPQILTTACNRLQKIVPTNTLPFPPVRVKFGKNYNVQLF